MLVSSGSVELGGNSSSDKTGSRGLKELIAAQFNSTARARIGLLSMRIIQRIDRWLVHYLVSRASLSLSSSPDSSF